MNDRDHLTRAQATEIAKEAAQETVKQLFERLDVDLDDPSDIRDLRADLAYSRRARVGSQKVTDHAKRALITAAVGGALYALWEGVRAAVRAKGGF